MDGPGAGCEEDRWPGEGKYVTDEEAAKELRDIAWGGTMARTHDPVPYMDKNANLTKAEVRSIRDLRESGWKLKAIADRFGVSLTLIRNIVLRRAFKHVD